MHYSDVTWHDDAATDLENCVNYLHIPYCKFL